MSESTWYYAKDGQSYGPFQLSQMRQLTAADAISPADPVRREGDPEWSTAGAVPDLAALPAASPQPGSGLVPCAKCGAAISDVAPTCPRCGERQPALLHAEEGYDGGECEACGTFNVTGTQYGFWVGTDGRCRGCGRPGVEAYPAASAAAAMEPVARNAVATARVVGWAAVAVVFAAVTVWAGRQTDPWSGLATGGCVTLFAGYFVYGMSAAAADWVVRGRAWRSGFGDPSPERERIRAYVAGNGRRWNVILWAYANQAEGRRPARKSSKGGSIEYVSPRVPAEPRGRRSRWAWAVVAATLVIIALAGFAVYKAEYNSQFERGRRAGVHTPARSAWRTRS